LIHEAIDHGHCFPG